MSQPETEVDGPDETSKAWVWAAAAALVVVVIAGSIAVLNSGSSEEPQVATDPSPAVSGSWSSGPLSVVFEEDRYAFVLDGILVEHGTYGTTDDAAIVYTSAEDSPGCAPGDEGRWTSETSDGSAITLSPVDDDCFFRAFIGAGPISMTAADSPIEVTGLPTQPDLDGKWGDEATGLAIDGNDYAIAIDGELIDRGTYELQTSPYLLVLGSQSTDANCATATYGLAIEGGDTLFLENRRIGRDQCTARSGIGMRPLGPGGTFEIPDTWGSNDG